MNKSKIIFNVISLGLTASFYVVSLILESKRTNKISENDKEDIAERVVNKIKSRRKQKQALVKEEV